MTFRLFFHKKIGTKRKKFYLCTQKNQTIKQERNQDSDANGLSEF